MSTPDLKISPEVRAYLVSREIPLPTAPPKWVTPSPGESAGAWFDPHRVDRVLAAFAQMRHTQGRWAGLPLHPDPWQIAYIIAPVFGWVKRDEDTGDVVRVVRKLYCDVPRKTERPPSVVV